MTNTYKVDSTKGLSKLQKDILVWLCKPSRFASPDEPTPTGQPWVARPAFRGEHIHVDALVKRCYSKSNSASLSRSLRSLADRGLILRFESGAFRRKGKTGWVTLTDKGIELGKLLSSKITVMKETNV